MNAPAAPPIVVSDHAEEVWRPVPGFEDRYEVSSMGRVRGFTVLKPNIKRDGYEQVGLWRPGSKGPKSITVHSLVAGAFIGPRPAGQCVRHKDGHRRNNLPENLEYGTYAQNSADMIAHGTSLTGERNPQSKLSSEQVREIRRLNAAGAKYRDLAKQFSVAYGTIYWIVTGRYWRHV